MGHSPMNWCSQHNQLNQGKTCPKCCDDQARVEKGTLLEGQDLPHLPSEVISASVENDALKDAAEMLWIVLANVSGGDWRQQSPEWQEAAARWRDNYFKALAASPGSAPAPPLTLAVELVTAWDADDFDQFHAALARARGSAPAPQDDATERERRISQMTEQAAIAITKLEQAEAPAPQDAETIQQLQESHMRHEHELRLEIGRLAQMITRLQAEKDSAEQSVAEFELAGDLAILAAQLRQQRMTKEFWASSASQEAETK